MRPPKLVLIWSADPGVADDFAYVMRLHSTWRPVSFEVKPSGLVARVKAEYPDLVIVFSSARNNGLAVVALVKTARPACPVLMVATKGTELRDTFTGSDGLIVWPYERAIILEKARVLAARKRGPRPGTPRPPRADQAAELEAVI